VQCVRECCLSCCCLEIRIYTQCCNIIFAQQNREELKWHIVCWRHCCSLCSTPLQDLLTPPVHPFSGYPWAFECIDHACGNFMCSRCKCHKCNAAHIYLRLFDCTCFCYNTMQIYRKISSRTTAGLYFEPTPFGPINFC